MLKSFRPNQDTFCLCVWLFCDVYEGRVVIVLASSNTFRIPFRPLPSLFGGGTVGAGEYIRSGREGKKRRTEIIGHVHHSFLTNLFLQLHQVIMPDFLQGHNSVAKFVSLSCRTKALLKVFKSAKKYRNLVKGILRTKEKCWHHY